jgi:uncharacterized protein YjbJ (UPF0337 family)
MNWDQVEGNWKIFKGRIKEKWGKLTDDELDQIAGRRDRLVGYIQKQYGVAREEAENQVREFSSALEADKDLNKRAS